MYNVLRIAFIIIFFLMLSACWRADNLSEGIRDFRVQNYRDAFVRLKYEAKKGVSEAQYAVGYMYYYGQGVNENRKKAIYWINQAARARHPEALAALDALNKVA